MPGPDPNHSARAERRAVAREADRRRQAAEVLRMAESMAGYAARVAGNGAAPEVVREAVLEAAGELEGVAARLRALVRLRLHERMMLARILNAQGMPRTEIAWRLGVSDRAVYYYVRGRPSP